MSPPPDDASSVTATKLGGSRAFGGPTFPPDAVLAGRYRIVRFIAKGGMGEVYEAEDQKLGGRVALKTVRADIAAEGKGVERFLREIKLARTITHPNVSRIFDLDEHPIPPPDGSSEPPREMLFLTMELLSGETLAERITRGRFTTAEAFDVVAQIAAGLDAAHAAGVIHRDFKSANVMLEPASEASKRPRAVVTDFGLARDADPDAALASISETGIVVGTPAYMAPEQVEGKPLTSAADLYSFGIVMYEMVTGTRPFTGGSPMTVAVKRLQESAPPPRKHIADLDPAWNAAILRCLERDPADRFATAADIVRALGGERVASGTGVIRRRKRQGVGAAVAAVAVAALALGVWFARRPSTGSSGATAPVVATTPMVPRKAVAVVGLKNLSGQSDVGWLGTAVGEMLASDLAAGEVLRVVPGEAVAQARTELALGDPAQGLSGDALARLGKALGADVLVSGSYTALGSKDARLVRIDLRLHDGKTGAVDASGNATGTEGQLFDLVSRAGGPLRAKLGLPGVSAAQALQVEASLPSNRDAARSYSEALACLRTSDPLGARDLLEKAVAAEPKHPLPHAALATAWLAMGYDAKAHEEAKKAVALSGSLSDDQKMAIEATFHETGKDWDKAIEAHRTLAAKFPDDLEIGLRLAAVQISASKGREALGTLETLRKLPKPASDDARLDLTQAQAYQMLGDAKQQQAFAVKAAAKGGERGLRAMEARARLLESVALFEQGDGSGARASAETARSLATAAGDKSGVGRALEQTARILRRNGDLTGARGLYASALSVYRDLGDLGSVARVLQDTGEALLAEGKLTEAQKLYDEALATFRQTGAKAQAAATLNNLGAKLQNAGDLQGAERRYREALSLFSAVGEKSGVAVTLTNLAELMFMRGDLERAQATHQESLAINREIGDKAGEGYDLYRLGLVLEARGDLRVARERFEESLRLLKEAGDRLTSGQVRVSLSSIALAESKAGDAESLAREAEEVLRSEGAADQAILAQAALAEALLAQKKLDDARASSGQAESAAAKSEDRRVRLVSSITAARVRAAGGKPDDVKAALASLDTATATANKAGFAGLSLEARLAAGEIARNAGEAAAVSGRLTPLARDAKAKGYELIAREASALLVPR